MNFKQFPVASLALITFLFTQVARSQEPLPEALDSMVGHWSASTVISAGKAEKWDHEVSIDKTRWTFKRVGSETDGETWSIAVVDSTVPKQVTMTRISAPWPQTINAIFEQNSKELRIAFLPGMNGSSLRERPQDLKSTPENRAVVFVLTR